ncbi:GHKL domain-containing protein [bacterium]|nr:GHKL domain-containing protein [bacterium]
MLNKLSSYSTVLLFCYLGTSLHAQTRMPYIFKEVLKLGNVTKCKYIDLENDGKDEALLLYPSETTTNFLLLRKPFIGKVIEQKNYPNQKIEDFGAHFLTSQNESRLCVALKIGNAAYMEFLDKNLDSLARVFICRGKDRNGVGGWDGRMQLGDPVDVNGDGTPDIPVLIRTGFDLYPRGLWMVDGKNYTVLWRFQTGCKVFNVLSEDLNMDGQPEFVLTASAVNNGASANGTDDKHSYILILDHEGALLWKYVTGEKTATTQVCLADLDGDHRPEIFSLTTHTNPTRRHVSEMVIWDGQTYSPKLSLTQDNVSLRGGVIIFDMDRDNKKEIAVSVNYGDSRGFRVYDERFNIIYERKDEITINGGTCVDVTGNGLNELVLYDLEHKKVFVLDREYKVLAAMPWHGSLQLFKRGFGKPPLLGLYQYGTQSEQVFSIVKQDYYISHWISSDLMAGAVIGSIVIFAVVLLFANILFFRAWWINKAGHRYSFIVGRKGQYIQITDYSVKIWTPVQKQRVYQQILKQNHGFIVPTFDETIFLFIQPIYGFWRVIGWQLMRTDAKGWHMPHDWGSMASKLAHELKNPLSTLLLTLQRLQMAYHEDDVPNKHKYDEYANSSMEEIRRLRRVSDGFMKYIQLKPPEKVSIPVKELLEVVVKQLKAGLPEYIQFTLEAEIELGWFAVDKDQMQALFFNFFDNAVKAMPEQGHLELRTIRIEKPDEQDLTTWIRIELSDTGCGLKEEQLNEVFKPFSSFRKDGTGLGLSICKKIVEDHGGRIKMHSKAGIGTTVIVELPVYHDKFEEHSDAS